MYLDNGSLAPRYSPDEKEKLAIQKKLELEKRKTRKQQMKLKRKFRARSVILIFAALSMAFLFVYGEVKQYEMSTAIDKANEQLSQVEDDKNRALLNIEKTRNLTSIENTAETKLGMSKATQDQVVYLDLEKQDKVQTSQVDNNIMHHAMTKGEKLIDGLSEKIRNIFSF